MRKALWTAFLASAALVSYLALSGGREVASGQPTVEPDVLSGEGTELLSVAPSIAKASDSFAVRSVVESLAEPEEVPTESIEAAQEEAAAEDVDAPRGGLGQWFLFGDEHGETLFDASLEVTWDGGSRTAKPNPDHGYIYADGLPAGEIRFVGRCDGYLPLEDVEYLPIEPERSLSFMLAPACRLQGSVTFRDGPPGPVEVLSWVQGDERNVTRQALPAEAEGRFSFEAASGTLVVAAVSKNLGLSTSIEVEVARGEEQEVELALDPVRSVVGQVIDQQTGEPLSEATVALNVGTAFNAFAEVGAASVDAEGRFLWLGAGEASVLKVSAAGRADVLQEVIGTADLVDVGTIALGPGEDVQICLDADRAIHSARYVLGAFEGRLDRMRFPADGCISLENWSTGSQQVWVGMPDGSYLSANFWVRENEVNRVEIPVAGYARANVRFEGLEMVGNHMELELDYSPERSVGCTRSSTIATLEGHAFEGIRGTQVVGSLWLDGVTYATATADIPVSGDFDLVFDLSPKTHVRILGANGLPIEGATVRIMDEARQAPPLVERTDADGRCSFDADAPGPMLASISHDDLGDRTAVPLTFQPDTTQDIVLDPSGSLAVTVQGPSGPATGASVFLADPAHEYGVRELAHVDAAGRHTWTKLHRGSYMVSIHGEGWFPIEPIVDVDGETSATLMIPRRADVHLTLTDEQGQPLSGVPIGLRSAELDADVRSWAKRKWIELPANGLQTDSAGVVELARLAAGSYEWSALGSSGTFFVTADERSHITVAVVR